MKKKETDSIWSIDQKEFEIVFKNVVKYRFGCPNEDGFYRAKIEDNIINNSIWNMYDFPTLDLKNLYEVFDLEWGVDNNNPDTTVIKENLNIENQKHYLYISRDGTFECIAESFKINGLVKAID